MFCCLLTIIIIIYLFIARRIYKSLNKNAASVLVTVWPWCAAWEKGCHSFSYYAGSESLYNLNWVGGWFHRNIQLMHCWKFVFHVFSFYLTGMQVPGFSLSRLVAHSIYVCPFLSESSHPWLTIAQLAEHLTVVQTSEIRVSLVRFRVVRENCQIEMDVKTPFFFLFVVFPGDTAETAFFFQRGRVMTVRWASGCAWESEIDPGLTRQVTESSSWVTLTECLWWHIRWSRPSRWPAISAWHLQPWPTVTHRSRVIITSKPGTAYSYNFYDAYNFHIPTAWDTYLFILAFSSYLIIYLTVNLIFPCIWLIFNLFTSYCRFLI